jgi:hypothetical protein
MNSPAINRSENKVSKFAQDLQGVNDDWPLLGELSQNKFVLKNKKGSLNVAKTAKDILEVSSREDTQMSESARQDDKLFEESFVHEVQDFKASTETVNAVANDVNEPLIQVETIKAPVAEVQAPVMPIQATVQVPIQAPIAQVQPVQEKVLAPEPVVLQKESKDTNPLLKLIAIGLTKLYVRKTTSVLNPVKFVAENYRNVLVAILHLGVPVLMSWFLITQVSFIKAQLVNTSSVMFWTYAVVFYFASLFVWVTGQVLVAGLLSMFKTTLVSVANDVENRD